MALLVFVIWLSLSYLWSDCLAYRPVIVMHGVFASNADMSGFVNMIKKAHPGTEVFNVKAYSDFDSTARMWEQVDGVYKRMKPFMDTAKDGINLICFSQGGLVCRGVIQKFEHNVHTFISLSSPQAGQFGDTDYLSYFFPLWARNHLYWIFYNVDGQDVSLANYWNDPFHQEEYYTYSEFLPFLNNGSNPQYKTNFLKIKKLVLIGGPDDGVITPWQSSHFGFYKNHSATEVEPFHLQRFYIEDHFGLQTLHKDGKIEIYEIPGVEHVNWHANQSVFDCCIEPWINN